MEKKFLLPAFRMTVPQVSQHHRQKVWHTQQVQNPHIQARSNCGFPVADIVFDRSATHGTLRIRNPLIQEKKQCREEYAFEGSHFCCYTSEIIIGADHQIDNNACYRNIKPNRIGKFNDFSVFGPLIRVPVVERQ